MWQNLSRREKRLVVITLVVILSTLTYRAIFLPQLERLWSLEEKAANLDLQVLEMERALALGDRIERQYTDYEAVIAQKGTPLEESTAFLRTVDAITRRNKIEVSRWHGIPTERSLYYNIFSIRITAKTRPVRLADFLSSLEDGKELIRVEDVNIKALDDSGNLSVDMKLTKVVAAGKNEVP